MGKNVLHLRISMAAFRTAKFINPFDLNQDEVYDSNDNNYTNGVAPDDDDSDDACMAIGRLRVGVVRISEILVGVTDEPAEDAEESRQDIDHENGTNEFP